MATRRVFYTLHTDLTDILEEQSDEQSGTEYIDPPAGRTVATAAQRSRPTTQPENKAEGKDVIDLHRTPLPLTPREI